LIFKKVKNVVDRELGQITPACTDEADAAGTPTRAHYAHLLAHRLDVPRLNRLFFALVPDASAAQSILEVVRQLGIRLQPGGRAIAAGKLHLTLSFLGDAVSDAQERAARDAASTVSGAPFEFGLNLAGSFAGRSTPWWLGPQDMPEALEHLQRSLQDALHRAQVPVDRKRFVPHVTVLRDARMRLAPTRVPTVRVAVSDFVLLRSVVGADADAAYQTVQRWPLIPARKVQQQLDLG
jgi:RNA 2',3'-cyclic 3'-phosphodiesterase